MTNLTDAGALPVSILTGDPMSLVAPDATLVEVAAALTDGDISVIGVGEPGSLLGVLSERDIVHAVANQKDPATTTAIELAQTDLIWADPDATVAEVAAEMMEKWVRHMLIGEPGGVPQIVSARDLLGAYAISEGEVA